MVVTGVAPFERFFRRAADTQGETIVRDQVNDVATALRGWFVPMRAPEAAAR